jgi:hypothetical protein
MTPRKITPSLVETFFKVAGYMLVRVYRNQAHKLVRYIRLTYLPMIKNNDGDKVKLELLLDRYAQTGNFEKHEGVEPGP